MRKFANKVAVIISASPGIAPRTGRCSLPRDARLALSDVSREGLDQTLGWPAGGHRSPGLRAQCHEPAGCVRSCRRGGARSWHRTFVFNNASATMIGTIAHVSIEEIEWQLSINLWGVIYGTKALLPMFLAQREGRIVNISSVFGLVGFPTQGAYNISKFGVRGLTECLWSELKGTGVSAGCVHPGGIRTNIERAGRSCKEAGEEKTRITAKAGALMATPPEDCAADIIRGIERGARRVVTGNRSSALFWLTRLFPDSYPAILKRIAA